MKGSVSLLVFLWLLPNLEIEDTGVVVVLTGEEGAIMVGS